MDVTPYINAAIAVLSMALTQAVKQVMPDDAKRYLPLLALLVGVACAVVTNIAGLAPDNVVDTLATGAVSGLAGCGVFELGKQLAKKEE